MLKINDYITAYTRKDYGIYTPEYPIDLDCSLGVNQEDLPDTVFTKLRELNRDNQDPIKQYPHDEILLDKLADWYKRRGIDWLKTENLILGCGSFDLLCNMNLLCLAGHKKVLGHAPQFSAYVDHVNCIGAAYCSYTLPRTKNYKFETEGYLGEMNSSCDLFIVENPNNPTGQEIKLKDVQKIAAKAESLHAILVVDEAYGDYMELHNSALNLIPGHPNVVVTRTFSKGFGMAGIRLGYAFISSENDLAVQLKKLEIPFNSNGVARILAGAVIDSGGDMLKIQEIRANKQKILKILTKLKAAVTSERTPIMTLYYDTMDGGFDLQRFLAEKVHLAAVGCAAYGGLDKRAVRLMLPGTKDVDEKLLPKLISAQNYLD
ncbi:MAG: aminotransferase class I/II-fold pyridoxal phosphate-dependent enzyme [Treponema sp.]|jgi:histidinol-phosphate aminotransferase|nr:aminotransferase class I/II-fold pyridoxal phosphate-dependent enzyme [Treponema sp.]